MVSLDGQRAIAGFGSVRRRCLTGFRRRSRPMMGELFAINGADMRRIPVQIGASDAELDAVVIDPLPENVAVAQSFRAGGALDADDVGREPVAIAAAKAAAVVGAVARGL